MSKSIAVLTCGRSDFSIYLPLLKILEGSDKFTLYVIVFGSHTSRYHGYTATEVEAFGFSNVIKVDTSLGDDDPESITTSIGLTVIKMAAVWSKLTLDWVLCLGDRHEMLAATLSAVSFNAKIVHFHGGEKTLGAIDNVFRHAITSLADYHFVSCENHQKRVREIIEEENAKNVFNVGSLALMNINTLPLLSEAEFFEKFCVDITEPTILLTYHPETVDQSVNAANLQAIFDAMDDISMQVIITLPNNDVFNSKSREALLEFSKSRNNVFTYDFMGVAGYYSAMSYCTCMIGNSSSGIIESASFGCYVINIGGRQNGRYCNENVFHTTGDAESIKNLLEDIERMPKYTGNNIYDNPTGLAKVVEVLEA